MATAAAASAKHEFGAASSTASAGGAGSGSVAASLAPRDSLAETADGRFVRTASTLREWVRADGSTPFPPTRGRYVLIVSLACPWSSRCLAVRAMKGLEGAIEVAVVSPVWARTKPDVDDHRGWVFDASFPGATAEPVFGAKTLREVYERAGANVSKYTVPVLLDRETHEIVNNESADIVRMFNSEFNEVAGRRDVDLYPSSLRGAIDAINDEVYTNVNNGVYRAGFATTQEAYEEAVHALFATLDKLDALLATRRYLAGATLTEADIRLIMTLVRHDEVYTVYFKCNRKRVSEYPHLFPYVRDVVQSAGIGPTIDMCVQLRVGG